MFTRGIPRGASPAGCSRPGARFPGIVEARGAIEVHEDGFRAELARPYVARAGPRAATPVCSSAVAEAYGAEVVEADGAGAVLAFCRERGLGLDESTVSQLLGPVAAEESPAGAARKDTKGRPPARGRGGGLALLVVAGLQVVKDPPGERVLHGRTGEIHINSR